MLNVSECSTDYSGWNWRTEKRVSLEKVQKQLADFENGTAKNYPQEARGLPYLSEPDVGDCFPHCDDDT